MWARADDTIGVFEPPARNSGIVGGKFLERARLKRADGAWYLQSDFYVGAKVRPARWGGVTLGFRAGWALGGCVGWRGEAA